MAGVTGSIRITDNASTTLKNIRSEQAKLRADAKKTSSALKSAWGKPQKVTADTSDAKKKLKSVSDMAKKIKPSTLILKAKDTASKTIKSVVALAKKNKAVAIALKAKDAATKVIRGVIKGLDAINRKVVAPVLKVVDKASGAVKGIIGKIGKAAKTVMIPVGIAAAVGGAALGGSVSAGMQLEQQQISIEHFVGATNKALSPDEVKTQSQSYIESLRENANATPFETGEVIQAGSRAVSLAGGDTSAAMDMVKLAEDMAAASGGTKSIMDAMEALGDLKVGETERLKEFGFKVSADEYKKKGFSGVSGDLQEFYGGAAGKLAGSGAGLMSTITGKLKSNAADFGLGVVEQIKPVMTEVISIIDEAQPTIQKLSSAFGTGLSKGIGFAKTAFQTIGPIISTVVSQGLPLISGFIGSIISGFQSISPIISMALSYIGPVIMGLVPVISQAAVIIGSVASGIATAISAVAPVVISIMSAIGEKIGGVVSFLAERSGFIQEVIGTAGPAIAEILSTAWGIVEPIMDILISTFELVFSVVQKVWPGIQDVISGVWSVLEPIFDTIGKGADLLAGAWSKVKNLVTGGGDSGSGGGGDTPGKNARGDNNWRGGPTWVGENGPELIDLPRGTRILPTKESAAWAARQDDNIIQMSRRSAAGAISNGMGMSGSAGGKYLTVQINKIADNITVRSDSDIDEIAERTAKKIIEDLSNIA